MGRDPKRPTENPSLLLLLAPRSQGPLEIKDQRTTRETARESKTVMWRDGPKKASGGKKQEGCHISEEPMWPSVITQTPGLLPSRENKQRGFLENVCETSSLCGGSKPASGTRPQLPPNTI